MTVAETFLDNVDFNGNQLLNSVFHTLASAPGSPVAGQFYYDSVTGIAYYRDGIAGAWTPIGLTAAGLLTLILTVDGSGSGLDADLLDGQSGAYYLSRTNHSGSQTASTISDFDTQVRTSRLDQMANPTASVSLNSQKITNLANGTANSDAANYGQLVAMVNGTKWLTPVRAKTTGNITLSGTQTIDGVSIIAGDRVAVFAQTTTTQDGIYLCAAGAWTRTTDLPAAADASNVSFFVQEGTANADTQWTVTNNAGGAVVGTDDLVVAQIGAGTSYTADGTTLTLSGTTFSINTSYVGQASITTLGTITTGVWNGTDIAVADGGTGSSTAAGARANLTAPGYYTALVGDGSSTSIAITQGTHGLRSDGVKSVSLYDASTGARVVPGVTVNNANGTVTLTFATAPSSNQFRVVIMG